MRCHVIAVVAFLLAPGLAANGAVLSARHHDVGTVAVTGIDQTGGETYSITATCAFRIERIVGPNAIYHLVGTAVAVGSVQPQSTRIICEARRSFSGTIVAAADVTRAGPVAAAVRELVAPADLTVFCTVAEAISVSAQVHTLRRQCSS